ncbi:acyltransferase [Geitlerinema sp. CS-897]|nr:acyltransferase [Geitlerinema sp. CS-897]
MKATVSNAPISEFRTRLPEFDFIRSLAILGVVLIHTTGAFLPEVERGSIADLVLLGINQMQRFCVPAFIILSGFWLSHVPNNFKNPDLTLKKRLLRVVPPYIFWSLVFEVYNIFVVRDRSLSHIFTDLILGKSVYVYYFIILILQFYILWWILVKINVKTIGTSGLAIALAVQFGFTVVRYSALLDKIPPLHYLSDRLILDWVFFFILGWYIGQHYERVRSLVFSNKTLIWGIAIFALLLSIIERDFIRYLELSREGASNFLRFPSQIYAVAFFLGCLPCDRSFKPLQTLSRYAFAIYLIHAPFVDLLSKKLIRQFPDSIFASFLILSVGILAMNIGFLYGLEKLLPKPVSRYILGV